MNRIKIITVLLLVGLMLLTAFLPACKKKPSASDESDTSSDDSVVESIVDGTESDSDTDTDEVDSDTDETESDTDETESDTDDGEDTIDEGESDSETDTDEVVDGMLIAEKGNVKFKIIFPEKHDESIDRGINTLNSTIIKYSGAAFVDFGSAYIGNYSPDTYEILIGDTGYPESSAVMDELGYGEWTVRFEGNKLVCTGFSPEAVNNALIEVIKQIKNGAIDGGTIALSEDLNVTKSRYDIANEIPRFANGIHPMMEDEGDSTPLAIKHGASVEMYEAYLASVESAGYTLHSKNTIGENRFAAYTNGEYTVNAGYYAYEKTIRVTIGKGAQLPISEKENVWTKNDSVVTSLASMGLGEADGSCMGYCYQLADGSFMVIDGGYENDAAILYDYMKAKAPGGEIKIAAWIITHADSDHRGAFVQFVKDYSETVTVEKLMINFPNESTSSELGSGKPVDVEMAASRMPDCTVYKVHTGQKFYIRNAVVEMLYTIDSSLPDKMFVYNDTSLVFTVDVEGERAMFTGDAGDEVAEILVSMYGDYLKSDILQLAHHGLRNGHDKSMPHTKDFYRLVRPEIVLWPNTNKAYLDTSNVDTATALMDWNLVALESARECYLAGYATTVLELPYSLYSAYIFDPNVTRDPVCKDTASTTDSLKYVTTGADNIISRLDWNND